MTVFSHAVEKVKQEMTMILKAAYVIAVVLKKIVSPNALRGSLLKKLDKELNELTNPV